MQYIYISYREALVACKNKFYLGEGSVIPIGDATPYLKDYEFFSDEDRSYLVSKILGCDKKAVEAFIEV